MDNPATVEEMKLPSPQKLALRGVVDKTAPVKATGEVIIDAPPEVVWQTLAKVQNWPAIRSDVEDVAGDPLAVSGGAFTWRTGPASLTTTFGLVEAPHLLTWSTVTEGLTMVAVYRFERLGDGRTRLYAAESLDAMAVAPQIDDAVLTRQIATWLEGIKAFAER